MSTYAEENSGFITQSMLKTSGICLKEYELQFVNLSQEEDEDLTTDAMIAGTAFDDFLSYGEKVFYEKWEILAKGGRRTDKLSQLTAGQYKTIEAAIRETKRQPLLDINGEYSAQSNIIYKYNGYKLKAKPDRICFDKEVIRDFKLVKDLESFELYSIYDYDYIFQLAFYQLLVFKTKGKWFKCYLDVIDKTKNSASKVYEIPQRLLDAKHAQIWEAVDALIDAINKKEFTSCSERAYCTKSCRMYSKCDAGAIQKEVDIIEN